MRLEEGVLMGSPKNRNGDKIPTVNKTIRASCCVSRTMYMSREVRV